MAAVFDTGVRVVPTWLEAAKHLSQRPDRSASNLVLEIADPLTITAADRSLMQSVDAALESTDHWPLISVAGTIFPLDMYRRYQRPAFYAEFERMMKRGKLKSGWGTYAQRMISRRSKKLGMFINPLETIVRRLHASAQPQGKNWKNSYELGVSVPEADSLPEDDIGGEIPTYAPELDGNDWYGFPCLSHVSIKRVPAGEGFAVDLTAVYRSHRYCERALGNLLGLSQLLWFIAKESELAVGKLTCISTHAELDTRNWGAPDAARRILAMQV